MDETDPIPTPEQVVRLVRAFTRIESATIRERIIEQIEDLDPRAARPPAIEDAAKPFH